MQNFTRRLMSACVLSAVAASSAMADTSPTIRAMFGAEPIKQLSAGKTALLVIDFQNEYFSGKLPIKDGVAALEQTRKLIGMADAANIPVYRIQHVNPAGSAVFASDSETAKLHPDMQPRTQDVTLQKNTVSVFGSTDLDARLKKAGIDTLIISGLMTHACVAGAARDAAPLGYKVVVASDASSTRSITRHNGMSIDQDALHKAALTEIEDAFGDVLSTAQILDLPVR
jgi:nicotinamidase-related amidase